MQLLRYVVFSIMLFSTVTVKPTVDNANSSRENEILQNVYLSFFPDPNLTTYANNFLSRLEQELAHNGINLTSFTNNQMTLDEAAQIDLSLHLHELGGNIIANSWPQKQNMSAISPIIINTFRALSWKVRFEQNDEATTQVILDLITALSMYSINQCDKANQYFSHAEKALPTLSSDTVNIRASIEFYRGTCALIAGDFDTAAHHYELSQNSNPKLTLFTDASVVNLAWVYIKLGRNAEAFQLMETEIARFNPKYSFGFAATALSQRSKLYELAFQYDDAVADLDLAIEYCLNSTSVTPSYCARYYTLRGQTYLLLYEWDNVLADYNTAIELDPSYADAYFYRGVLFYSILQTGQTMYTEALADFNRYLELAPDGDHAAEATRYLTDIQIQQNALNN